MEICGNIDINGYFTCKSRGDFSSCDCVYIGGVSIKIGEVLKIIINYLLRCLHYIYSK